MCNRTPIPNNTSVWIAGAEYQIIEQIGAGGQSLIYRAKQLENDLHKEVVIKEFFPNYGAIRENRVVVAEKQCDQALFQEQKRTNFIRNHLACEVAKKSHQAQYTAYVHDLERGLSVHPMLPQDCVSIERVLHSMGNRDSVLEGRFYTDLSRVKKSIKIIKSLLGAVSRIHESGLLHLDLSIGNVFWGETTADGTAYIIDYGSCVENGYCSTAPFWSSAGYAAPELSQSFIRLTPKSDLYSVGVILMLLCCGEKCLDEGNPIELPGQNYRNVRRYTSKLNIPVQTIQKLENIIIKSTRRDGDSNYEVAEDMLQDIVSLEKTMDSAYISLANNIPSQLPSALWLPRPNEFKDLSTLLDEGTKEIFVFGDGGLGKTEFIVSFANKYRGHYDFYFTTYKGSVRDTVLQLQFDGWDPKMFDANTHRMVTKPTQQQFEEKLQLLRAFPSEAKAVLIIDNFDTNSDDADPLADSDLPHLLGLNVQLIMTTRMNLPQKNHVEIKRFSTDELMVLMHRHLGNLSKEEIKTLERIIDQVDRNTLLVDLIARLLRDSLLGMSPNSVLMALQDRKWGSLSEKVSGEYNREASPKTVLSHLLTLFDLSAMSEDAGYILSCAALLPAEGINCPLFMQCLGKEEKWLNVVSKLRRAGWINHDRQKARISIHPLVREACVQETTLKPTWERQGLFILAVLKAADTPCSHQMVLQIMEVLRQICLIIPPNKLYLDFVAEIYLKTGWLYELCGNYQAAQEFMNVAQCLRSDLPETHHSITRTKSHLAGIKQQLGCYAEAETLFYEVLALRQKQLESVDHPNLAADHNNLCGVLLSTGKYEDSIRHGLRALELLNRSDNYTSRDLCLVYSALSTAYGQIEDYVQQLSYAQKAVDIIENDSSVHPKIMITAYSKLCISLHNQQRWNEMLTYALKTLHICEKELPVDHPSYATAYGRLADAYYSLNQYDKALEYITYKISVCEKVLPALHPNIGSSYFIKGRILFEQKKYTDAYAYFNSAKQLFTRAYGEDHSETKSCDKALAITEDLLKA